MTQDDPAHLGALEWAEREFDLQAGFGSTIKGDEVVVSGTCPRCKATTGHGFPMGQMGSVSAEAVKDFAAAGEIVTMICECGFVHDKKPSDSTESGCGAFWKVRLPSVGGT